MRNDIRHGFDIHTIAMVGKEGPSLKVFVWIGVLAIICALYFIIPADFEYIVEKWTAKEDFQVTECVVVDDETQYTLRINICNNGSKPVEGIPAKIRSDNGIELEKEVLERPIRFKSLASGLNVEALPIPARAEGTVVIEIAKMTLEGADSLTLYFETLEEQKITVELP